MANVCDYRVECEGPQSSLDGIVAFLSPHLVRTPNGYYANAYFQVEKMFPNEELKDAHEWIGVNIDDLPSAHWHEYVNGKLVFDGACKWAPPIEVLVRLSRQFPEVVFECFATTEHEVIDRFVVRNGIYSVIDYGIEDIRGGYVVWHVRDGEYFEHGHVVFHEDEEIIPEATDTYEV